MSKIEKVLLTGKTHTVANGAHKVDLNLTGTGGARAYAFTGVQAHPTAEQLFTGAWSACYISAVGLVAQQLKVKLPASTAVDLEVDLGQTGDQYFLQARLKLIVPGLDQELANRIAHEADQICPYSKATRGNIEVSLSALVA